MEEPLVAYRLLVLPMQAQSCNLPAFDRLGKAQTLVPKTTQETSQAPQKMTQVPCCDLRTKTKLTPWRPKPLPRS